MHQNLTLTENTMMYYEPPCLSDIGLFLNLPEKKTHVVFGAPYMHFRLLRVQHTIKQSKSIIAVINYTKYIDTLKTYNSKHEKSYLEGLPLR